MALALAFSAPPLQVLDPKKNVRQEAPLPQPPRALAPEPLATPQVQTFQTQTCDLNYVALAGDEQYHFPWGPFSAIRSATLRTLSPAYRNAAMELFIGAAHEEILRQTHASIPADCRSRLLGQVHLGDATDLATVPELDSFLKTLERLKDAPELYKMLLFIVGNHEIIPSGVNYGDSEFFYIPAIYFNVLGGRDYRTEVHGMEAGGQDKRLDKATFIKLIMNYLYKNDPGTVRVDWNDSMRFSVDGKSTYWDAPQENVFSQLWKPTGTNGTSWRFLVNYKPDDKSRTPQEQWIYTPATLLNKGDTENPTYMIGLDSMDFTSDSTNMGALKGHIGNLQVRAIRNFMDVMKKQTHGKAKFVFVSHYPMTSMDSSSYLFSGLSDLLSDESVVAVLAAHTHKRNYADLNSGDLKDDLNLHRTSPLPQVTFPAIMDPPNEMGLFSYGYDKEGQFTITIEYKSLVLSKHPKGTSTQTAKALEEVRPYQNAYQDALDHIYEPWIHELANPITDIWRRAYLLIHDKHGVFWKSNGFLTRYDVLPTTFARAKSYSRLLAKTIELSLLENNLTEEGNDFKRNVGNVLDLFQQFYEAMWAYEALDYKIRFLKPEPGDEEKRKKLWEEAEKIFDTLDQYKYTLTVFLQHTLETLEQKLINPHLTEEDRNAKLAQLYNPALTDQQKAEIQKELENPDLSADQKNLIAQTLVLVGEFGIYLEETKGWFRNYHQFLKLDRGKKRGEEANKYFDSLTNLLSFNSMIRMRQALSDIPRNTETFAFMVGAFLESSEIDRNFLLKKMTSAPDTITIKLNKNGAVEITDPSKTAEQETQFDLDYQRTLEQQTPKEPTGIPYDDPSKLHYDLKLGFGPLTGGEIGIGGHYTWDLFKNSTGKPYWPTRFKIDAGLSLIKHIPYDGKGSSTNTFAGEVIARTGDAAGLVSVGPGAIPEWNITDFSRPQVEDLALRGALFLGFVDRMVGVYWRPDFATLGESPNPNFGVTLDVKKIGKNIFNVDLL